ncbi:MAG TPA: META domain-containing protein [Chitinophagaceae bacterium]|nr:META domain-containing protein [Chitinophagaceae bacterium]
MKNIIIALLAASLLFACSSSRNSAAELNNLNGFWSLTVFPAASKTMAELFSMRTPDMQLDVPNRRVSGTTGCNRISGPFTIDGAEFRFGSLATTKMGCPGYDETVFLDALGKVNRFQLNNDQLSLYQDSTLLMTFAKRPNP